MRRLLIAFILTLAACGGGAVPPPIEAGADAAFADAGADAGPMDAGPRWRELCGVAIDRPVPGEDAYCPAVDDYVARALTGDGGVPDAQVCDDAGCLPADRAWGVLESCPVWANCGLGGPQRCYHCTAWGPDPWGL